MLVEVKGKELEISVDTLGAELMSIRNNNGVEFLWQGNPEYWKNRAILLFPIIGALRGNKAVIDGKEYTIKQHGFAREREFEVTRQNENSVTMMLESDEATKSVYPYDFQFNVTYSIEGRSVKTAFEVVNKTDGEMLYFVGGHPGFNIPLLQNESLTDYCVEFSEIENADILKITGDRLIDAVNPIRFLDNTNKFTLNPETFTTDALVFDNLKSRKVRVYNAKSADENARRGITMEFKDFEFLAIWQPYGAPFVCLEPWTGHATLNTEDDLYEHKRGVTRLGKGESKTHAFTVSV